MNNKFNFNSANYREDGKPDNIFHIGVVEDNLDAADAGRIKVRVKGIDDHITDVGELPFVFPLMSKFIHVIPKAGETVWVMFPDKQNPFYNRVYIGPIISQPQNLRSDPHVISSTAGLDGGFAGLKASPSSFPESKGIYPNVGDVAIQGRYNNDILLKENEIQIRVGKFNQSNKDGEIPHFNKLNPTYIQLKQSKTQDEGGVINVVGSKINLLSHKDGNPRFNLSDQDNMISDEQLSKILDEAHPLVFGDLLIEYLNLLKEAFINHVHAYNGTKPEDLKGMNAKKKFLEFDVSRIISKNIKIN
jgi:hypothetical protein